MTGPLNLVIVEDSRDDAELAIEHLRAAGFELRAQIVDNEADYLAALTPAPDVVLADYSLPEFNGLRALELLRARDLDIPFILISGTLGEERAVEAMRTGAWDYVMKDRIARLGAAFEHALERKRLRDARRRDEERIAQLAAIVESSGDAIVSRTVDGTIVSWNGGAERMFGWSAAEAVGQPISIIVPKERRSRFWPLVERALAGEAIGAVESTNCDRSGKLIETEVTVSAVRDAAGKPSLISLVYRDISERKRLERAAAHQARITEMLEALARTANEARNAEEAMRMCLAHLMAFGGWALGRCAIYEKHAALRRPDRSLWEGRDLDRFNELIAVSDATDHFKPGGRFITPILRDKAAHWLPDLAAMEQHGRLGIAAKVGLRSAFAVPIVIGGTVSAFLEFYGEAPCAPDPDLVAAAQAIAGQLARVIERDRARAADAQLASIVRAADDAIVGVSRDGTIIAWNTGAEALFGFSAAEAIGQSNLILYPEDERHKFPANLERAIHAAPARRYEAVRQAKNGTRVDVAVTVFPVKDEAGALLSIGVIYHDITERKQREREIARRAAITGLLERLARAVNEAGDPQEALQSCLELICAHGAWALGRVMHFGPGENGTVAVSRSRWRTSDPARFEAFMAESDGTRYGMRPGGFITSMLKDRKPCWIRELLEAPDFARLDAARECGLRAAFALPLLVDDEVAACLEFFATEPREPDELLLEAAPSVASQLARTIERARAAEAQARLATIVESAEEAIVSIDAEGTVLTWNPAAERLFGYAETDIVGRNIIVLIPEEEREQVYARRRQALLTGRRFRSFESERIARDGRRVPVSISSASIRGPDGSVTGFAVVFNDITERKRREAELRAAHERLEAILGSLHEVVYSCDYETYAAIYVSPAVEPISGHGAGAFRDDPLLWFRIVHPDDQPAVNAALATLKRDGRNSVEYRIVRPDGAIRFVQNWAQVVRDEAGRPLRIDGVVIDISERKLAEERAERLTHYDALTDLPNRLLFQDRLQTAIAHARRRGEMLAVMLINLDRFKKVNEDLGFEAGDRLIRNVAERLQRSLREADTLARVGGDEFVVLVEAVAARADIGAVAEKVLQALSEPFEVDGHEIFVSAGMGIAVYPDGAADGTGLMQSAEIAMWRAKQEGSGPRFYDEAAMPRSRARLEMESQLRRALERREFALHYQPKVELATGAIRGVEALLRWKNPLLGEVSPAVFIPLAEETGLIIPIGAWVLRAACEQSARWRQRGRPLKVAVNLSPRQFRDRDLVAQVAQALGASGLPAADLELEITESTAMSRAEQAIAILDQLRALGVTLAVDDFGTGYSSLSYLKRFPLNCLKIDRAFVRDVDTDANSAAIVRATIGLAHSLNFSVVAEGVENEKQHAALLALHCDQGQGFLYGKPLPVEELDALLERGAGGRLLFSGNRAPEPGAGRAPRRSRKPGRTSP